MYLLKSIINLCIIVLLLRLLIKSNEAYFDPIYRIIFRVTDPILKPSGYLTRVEFKGITLTIIILVLLRGLLYTAISHVALVAGMGISVLDLAKLLYQAYMVFWVVSLLSQEAWGTSFLNLIQRALQPLYQIRNRLSVARRHFHLVTFLILLIAYALVRLLIYYIMISQGNQASLSIIQALGDGLILFIGLFPGFFSLVIIVGALLSWVSPDPYNPIVQAIYGISEPLLSPFRRFIPPLGGIDITPIVALLCFQLVGNLFRDLIAGILQTM
jgi:YggT family protein